MSNFKRYDKYKDSGIEWIGEIPEEWEVIPLKRIFKIINGGTPNSSEESYWNGEIVWITPNDLSELTEIYIRDSERKITEDGINNCSAKIVPKDSIIISTRAPIGYIAIAGVNLCTNQGCKSLIPVSEINSKFFYYFILSINFYLNVLGQGTTFMELSNSNLSMVELLKPPIDEQISIANFLDQKTAEIDDLITDKEKLIELLQEKRQAVITEAVTKGLNPNVKMKDSGIEWIGDIPEGWEITKLKYICSITMGQSPKSEEYSREEGGLPFLQGNAEFTELYPHPKIYCDTANKRSKVNDILLSVRAPVGKMNISNRVYGIGRGLCAITAQKVHLKYLWYSMNVSLEELSINSQGSTFEAVTVADVNNLSAIVPPTDEQISIANFLDQKTAEIDSLVSEIQEQIQKLREYRQALIFEAVTGKIDVRDYAAVS
ncbi:restriction endonuclease subunit S [Tepidanaerobacter sp. EBM-49]|uniref:restriction endonuclease subunit S n=1 Tax=Tepidanaerobacter sp. EBM-49 TaxID=1918504 RepID=UPI000A5F58D3|nr:restriction endonuclease subunit S [Tepidanaerobacter sp. EBM-49]